MTNSDSIVVTPGTELPFACASSFFFSCFFCFETARANVVGVVGLLSSSTIAGSIDDRILSRANERSKTDEACVSFASQLNSESKFPPS